MSAPPSGSAADRWIVLVLVALAPIWLVGTLNRGLWTPDEPREADIAWRMSQQSDHTLPQLAGVPFLEKPPLSYWVSAEAMQLFGHSPAAARAPNILYAAITTLAVGALAFAMAGSTAAIVASLVAATAIIVFRVTVWLAPDAALLAGCAISLLGAYKGFTAPAGRRKLLGYGLMHAGAALGFMAKSAPGWMAPALALATLIAWERRWSELRRWELYAGLLLQALVIGPWILAVAHAPQGGDALLALFWHNVVGRFTKVAGPTALDYTTGHRNTPGKYFLELPVYLLPWTLLVGASLCQAWQRARIAGAAGTPWRFALAAALPFLLVLSVASTARDIYCAPALLGFAVLVGIWLADAQSAPTRLDLWAIRWTRWLVAFLALGFAAFSAILALASSRAIYLVATAVVIAITCLAVARSARAQSQGNLPGSFAWTYFCHVVAVCVTALATFPSIDRWHDLPRIAARIHADSQGYELALLTPDETTIAMLDDGLLTRFTILDNGGSVTSNPRQLVAAWFGSHGANARVLVLLPGHAPGELTRLFAPHGRRPDDGIAGTLVAGGVASMAARYDVPQGRRYMLLAPPTER